MRRPGSGRGGTERGQVVVWFAFALVVALLVSGLALDLGMLYRSEAMLSRACDGATLAGWKTNWKPGDGRPDKVAQLMRSVAIANAPELKSLKTEPAVQERAAGPNRVWAYAFGSEGGSGAELSLLIAAHDERGIVRVEAAVRGAPQESLFGLPTLRPARQPSARDASPTAGASGEVAR